MKPTLLTLSFLGAMMIADNVNAQESTLKEPVTKLTDLTIMKEYDMTLPFIVGKSYENKTVSVTLEGIYDALGTTSAELDSVASNYTFTRLMNTVKETDDAIPVYSWSDDLAKPEDAAGGSWFGAYYQDTDDGTDPVYIGNAPKGWGTGNSTFYTQEIKLNDGEFSITTGQYPDGMKEGNVFSSILYIINGNKAAAVTLTTNVYVPTIPPFAEMTSVGDTTIAITAEVSNDYITKNIQVDIEKVYSLLGCQASDISELFAFSDEGVISNEHTADYGGFFFNENGFIDKWDGNGTFYITAAGLPDGKFAIGQRPNRFDDVTEEGKLQEADFLFIFENKYYKVHLAYTVIPAVPHDEVTLTLKSKEYITKQIVPHDTDYPVNANTALDLDYIASVIGTKDFTIYSDTVYTYPTDLTKKVGMSDKYNCDPRPGFWFGSNVVGEGDYQDCVTADGWSGSSSFGVSYVDGELVWFRYPGTHNAGDTYNANLYFVNTETGAYMQYEITVKYVDEIIPDAEVILTEDAVVFVDETSTSEFEGIIDNDKICELFGIESIESVFDELSVVFVKSPTQTYTESIGGSAAYSANGYADAAAEDSGAFFVGIDRVGDRLAIVADYVNADDKQMDAVVNIGIEYAGKRIMFKVTFTTTDPATGIAVVGTDVQASSSVYSLSGALIPSAVKGVNIVRGKKVLVK